MAKGKSGLSLRTASYPSCGAVGSLREIVYGMPGPDFDFDKYIVGGCCVTENDPDIGCKECGWNCVGGMDLGARLLRVDRPTR